jgi:hypothetical protein
MIMMLIALDPRGPAATLGIQDIPSAQASSYSEGWLRMTARETILPSRTEK